MNYKSIIKAFLGLVDHKKEKKIKNHFCFELLILGLETSSNPIVIKKRLKKIIISIAIGKPHHHHMSRKIAEERIE